MAAMRGAVGQSLVVVRWLGVVAGAVLACIAFGPASAFGAPASDDASHLTPAPTSVDHVACDASPVDESPATPTIAPSAGGTVVAFTLVWAEPAC